MTNNQFFLLGVTTMPRRVLLAVLICLISIRSVFADEPFTRREDVIYGRKFGTALTMDVFTPKETPNRAAVIFVVSGGWFSAHEAINQGFVTPLVNKGYTVFAVVHGSQPRFTIPEAISDLHRSIRFIRSKADEFHIDSNRFGIIGGSAGGHLSLMMGTSGQPENPQAKDPVDRHSSRVQAVACFYPPTDFLNWGEPGVVALGTGPLGWLPAPFDFVENDTKTKRFERITDEEKLKKIGQEISPITHVSADDPPTLIIHGDADKVVPIQQANIFIDKLKEHKIPCELVLRPGAGHGWPKLTEDLNLFVDWFDKHLAAKPANIE